MAVHWGRRGGCARLGLRPSAASSRLAVIALLVLLLLFAFPCAGAQSAASQSVVKLVTFRFGDPLLDILFKNIFAGLRASFYSRKFIVGEDVSVEIVHKITKKTDYPSDLSTALSDKGIYALVGHCGDQLLQNVKDVLAEHDVVAFAPFTGSGVVRGWNPNVYFLRADPATELLALLRFAVARLRVLRMGFTYPRNILFWRQRVRAGRACDVGGGLRAERRLRCAGCWARWGRPEGVRCCVGAVCCDLDAGCDCVWLADTRHREVHCEDAGGRTHRWCVPAGSLGGAGRCF
ncbi:receptor-type adenylate cyclase [Trypanosoma rangeli]|uniref:Receptor-type adenylate cyclase n=1 Tax=Trypanosoma rangeli TaxID=5698 RepID=A0A3R7R716_TRYRA|nr:receptor-type adenylate cyclase [Trypanosoma rangeli]RNE97081.1 receptor-type adenylate cyclase [Trypanosoma rangeli]|eukprot:RNE97081.1 receptor-type adenylate cyclase [Trypanosoma rangeli]